MKRFFFYFLGFIMFGMSGCVKPGDNIQEFPYIPAIVDLDFQFTFGLALRTPYGLIVSNEIRNAEDLWEGDAVVAFFTVNYDQQPSQDYTFAYDLNYAKGGRGSAIQTEEGKSGTGDFDLFIESMGLYGGFDNLLFLGFSHKNVGDNDRFIYEMTYDVNEPVLYIRARKSESGSENPFCAFSMYSFYSDQKNAGHTSGFTIQYKSGVKDGEDDYTLLTDQNGNSTFPFPTE